LKDITRKLRIRLLPVSDHLLLARCQGRLTFQEIYQILSVLLNFVGHASWSRTPSFFQSVFVLAVHFVYKARSAVSDTLFSE